MNILKLILSIIKVFEFIKKQIDWGIKNEAIENKKEIESNISDLENAKNDKNIADAIKSLDRN